MKRSKLGTTVGKIARGAGKVVGAVFPVKRALKIEKNVNRVNATSAKLAVKKMKGL
jgi:hypothetical protein